MSRRMKSVELMKYLQPFTQLGVLPAAEAQDMVQEYVKGTVEGIKEFIFRPTHPMNLTPLLKKLEDFIATESEERV